MWNIDERSLELTARALETVNPGRCSESHIRDMIRANMDYDIPGKYISTGGWVAFSWVTDDGKVWISVALTPYSVCSHLDLETQTESFGAG